MGEFIKKELGCFAVDYKKGTQFGMIDVIGLRYVMGDYGGSTELVAVEVKPEEATFLKSLGQASAYSVMADRCYLAIHKRYGRPFTQEEKDVVAKLNVGLIEIGKQKSCKVIASSPQHYPIQAHKLHLIRKMGYVECRICGLFFLHHGMRSLRERSNIVNAIREEKPFRYWLMKFGAEREEAKKGGGRKDIHDRRYICQDCVQVFSGLVPRK